jgi:CheY-like chemotaxis protein
VAVTLDGNETWQALQAKGAPQLAILDWMMPGMGGVGLKCHLLQAIERLNLILNGWTVLFVVSDSILALSWDLSATLTSFHPETPDL